MEGVLARFKKLSPHLSRGTEENHEKSNQDSLSSDPALNQRPSKHKAGLVTCRPRLSVHTILLLFVSDTNYCVFEVLLKMYRFHIRHIHPGQASQYSEEAAG
jgi:hypothetical protein